VTLRVPAGSLVLSPEEARVLYQAAGIGKLRERHRIGNSPLYALLTELSVCAFSADAAAGTLTRQDAASEEREIWSVRQLARASGRAERTIRHDIELGSLPAVKNGNSWTITRDEATTYLARWNLRGTPR
jgi:hypothetical protein